jgi:hypothetical protein
MSDAFPEAQQANADRLPAVRSIFDLSSEALGQLRTWLEQNPPSIPVTQIIGYQTNTVRIYKKATGTLTVVNTATETDVLNETIPASTLGTTGGMRVTLLGDYLNNSGSAKDITVKFYFGGTVFHTVAFTALGSTSFRRPMSFEYSLANLGTTGSQMGFCNFPQLTGDPTLSTWLQTYADSGSIDTTVSQVFKVTVTHSGASASTDYTRRYYMVEFF